MHDMPNRQDWQEVYDLARKQGVEGVVMDALEKVPANMRPPKQLLLNWIGRVAMMEKVYEQYAGTVKILTDRLGAQGLAVMLMKGYGCSLNYPRPMHRPCGDIDIFVMTPDGVHTKEVVRLVDDWAAKQIDCQLIHDNEHHSVFRFGNFVVENHETILDINTHKSSVRLNRLLEDLARESLQDSSGKQGLFLPSVRFNSIHLLRHMANDFATVKTSLRQVLDWSTFVCAHADEIDWKFVYDVAHQMNMNRFLDAIHAICVDYLKASAHLFPIEKRDDKLRDKVMADILNEERQEYDMTNKLKYCWGKSCRMWRNRWKYRIVYDECLLSSFLTLAHHRVRNL